MSKQSRKLESEMENIDPRHIQPDADDDGYTDGVDIYVSQHLDISKASAIQTIAQVLDQMDRNKVSTMDMANKIAFELGLK